MAVKAHHRTPADAEKSAAWSKKQVVVVIHGMGEQRPLETLRSFVETVYQRDPTQTFNTPKQRVNDPVLGAVNRVWIVPDAASGTVELRRFSTPTNRSQLRTDFFEFYWADIMQGTPAEMVWGWIRGLLLRSPFRVPRRTPVWIAWILLWVLAILFAGFSFAILEPDKGPFGSFVASTVALLAGVRTPLAMILAGVGVLLLAFRAFATRPVSQMKFGLPVVLLVSSGVLLFFWDAASKPRAWAAVLTAGVAALIAGIVVPYVGDVARYTRATPSTIAKREAVRARGLALLRALHDQTETKDGVEGRVYDRIVLVAHSLGAIVAYDLLSQLWEERGPNHKRGSPPSDKVIVALKKVDAYVAKVWVNDPPLSDEAFPVLEYQKAQAAVFKALAESKKGWLISDFITVGSPLVHAEFLMADSRDELSRNFRERFLCSSPPRPDEPSSSMLYDNGYAHFAAPFAAVRWTNIYDEHWFPLFGDIVSGPVRTRERFGPGINEHRVAIRQPWLGRFVTHSLYWTWRKGYADKLPDHIRLLREALALSGDSHDATGPAQV